MFNGAIITAQLPISEWHAYLGNETIAYAAKNEPNRPPIAFSSGHFYWMSIISDLF